MDNTVPAPERAARPGILPTLPSGWVECRKSLRPRRASRCSPSKGNSRRRSPSRTTTPSARLSSRRPRTRTSASPTAARPSTARRKRASPPTTAATPASIASPCPSDRRGASRSPSSAGRRFLRSADYRALAERIRTGDLSDLLSADLFHNVIFALAPRPRRTGRARRRGRREFAPARAGGHGESARAKRQAARGNATASAEGRARSERSAAATQKPRARQGVEAGTPKKRREARSSRRVCRSRCRGRRRAESSQAKPCASRRRRAATEWLLTKAARACSRSRRTYGVESFALMLRADDTFYAACVDGAVRAPRAARLAQGEGDKAAARGDAAANPSPSPRAGAPLRSTRRPSSFSRSLVGEEIKGALLVGDADLTTSSASAVAAFCRDIAMPLELLRLREELERRVRAASHLRAFTEVVNSAQPEDAYTTILRHSAELLRAERGSLLLFDERAGELSVKAAVGPRADVAREARVRLGEGVVGHGPARGPPAVVRDVSKVAGWQPAPGGAAATRRAPSSATRSSSAGARSACST